MSEEVLLGHTEPRIFTPPLRPLTPETSLGFAVIDFAALLEVPLYPWQEWLLIHALELHPSEDRFRFRTVLVLVARQNGKTYLGMLLGLFALYVLRLALVLGTAQDLDLAEETWEAAVDLVTEVDDEDEYLYPDLAAEVGRIVRVNGRKALVLKPAEDPRGIRAHRVRPTWKVKATNRKAGRGKTSGLVFLDELREHTTWEAWAALSKTTIAVQDALVWAMTNAGDPTSVVLRHLRRIGHLDLGDPDGQYRKSDDLVETDDVDVDRNLEADLGLFEWSAPPGSDRWDREAWAYANPSCGHGGMSERTIASAVRTDPPEVVTTEVLCQWSQTSKVSVFGHGVWGDRRRDDSFIPAGNRIMYGLAVSYDRDYTTLVAAGRTGEGDTGDTHVEVVARSAGTSWPRHWFLERASHDNPMSVVFQTSSSPSASLITELQDIEGLTVVPWKGTDLGIAHSMFFDMVTGVPQDQQESSGSPAFGRIVHLGQPILTTAAETCGTRPLTAGVWVWRLLPAMDGPDGAPLLAATAAVWALHVGSPVTVRSAYEDYAPIVV